MAYTTTTTSITSATSSRSKQATVYQYPTGNGVVITGASVNSNTTAYLGVTTPGAAQTYTAVSGGATITEIVYLDSDNVPTNANAVSTTGGNIKIVGTGFASGSKVYINNALVTNTVPNSTAIIATLTTGSVGNVSCYIFGSGNSGGAISANSVRFSGAPSWVTAAAVSSVNGIASNIALQASGDGTLTYALKSGSGSLPTGITLLSSGYLTGTATGYSADTVVTFTLIVRDTENQATQQTFNYTVFIGDTYFKQTSLLLSATVSNTFISDSSVNNFLITRNGDTRPSRFSPYWPGGWSGYFDGTGDYLTVPQSTSFDLPGDFTVECWVYFNSVTSTSFVGKWGGSGTYAWLFQYIAGTGLRFYTGINGGLSTTIDGAWTPVVNIWYHIAATRNSNSVRLFVNGTQVGTTTTNSDNCTATNQALNIGRNADTNIQLLTGYLSNLRILKGTALYTANFTPATTSLTTVANTSLLTLRDAILADDSPYNFTITRNGDTKLTTFSPFNTAPHTVTANTNSVYFDGTGDYLSVADNSELNVGTGDFTIEAWVNRLNSMSGAGNGDTIVGKGTNNGILFIYVTGSTIGFSQYGVGALVTSTTVIENGRWYHVAVTRSGTTLRLFVNGVLESTATSSANFTSSTALQIGQDPSNSGQRLNGLISNFRFVKGTAVYTANFTPATSALTAISGTSLLACQANTIIDSNTTPKTITVNGNPNVSLANPFGETVSTISNYTWSPTSYGASAYFDGNGDNLTVADGPAFEFSNSPFTIECWIYVFTLKGYQGILSKVGAADANGWLLYFEADNSLRFLAGNSGTWTIVMDAVAAGTFKVHQWTHLAVTRDSANNWRFFVDGALRASVNNNFTINDTGGFCYIGKYPFFPSYATTMDFSGYISNIRILKGTALYTTSFIPPTAPLTAVANTSLLTLQSDIGSNSAQFVDQSPNNHLITRNGNASQGTYGPLVPSTWSAYFDGSGDYLTVPNNTAFNFGTGDFTIECWIYTISSATQRIISYANASNTPYELLLVNTGSNVYLDFYDGTSDLTTGSNYVAQNSWAHVAVTRSGTALRLFINGVISGSFTNSVNLTSAGSLFIGRYQPSDLQPFVGYISNLRIVKGTALYTANFTPSTTTISPVANTSLLTLRGPAFTDDSGNNLTITRFGDTKIVPFGPFSPQIVTPDSYSYRFSNASDYISTTSSNLAFGSNNWTIESWVYPRFTANSGVFQVSNVQYGLTNSNLNTVALGFSNSNKAIVRVANATYTSTGTSITANAWTHLALVKSSNVSKLYINGTLDSTIGTSGSITDTVSYTGTTNVAVGGYGSTSALANAYISNFRVVSNSAVYTENFTPAVGPLSAISGTTVLTCQANTVIDASTANLTITANANVTPSNFNPFDETVTVGQAYSAIADGGSVYFDGTGDYLNIADNNIWAFAGDFTVEAWAYPTSVGGAAERMIAAQWYGGTIANTAWLMGINSTGYPYSVIAIGSTQYTITSATAATANTWYHVAISRSGSTFKMFINGQLVGSATASGAVNNIAYDVTIGAINSLGTVQSNFIGYISNLRILSGTCLYTANFVPAAGPALPTTANTSLLLNFTSSGVIDSTGRNVLETVADAKVTTNLKKYGTGSYYFDGTTDCLFQPSNVLYGYGTGDFTIEFWLRISDTAQRTILSHLTANGSVAPHLYYFNASGIRYYTNSADRITGGALTVNQWYHIALSRASGNTKMFIDGTQTGSTYVDTNNYGSSNPLIVGDYGVPLTGTSTLSGYISDLRITNGYARYTANFTVPSEPFITK